MIWTMVRKEWWARLRNGQFRVISASLIVLLWLATAVSLTQWMEISAARQRAQQRDREQWLNQGASALAIGQMDLLPLQEPVSIRTRQRTVADKEGLEKPQQLAGRFDLAFVIVYLLPLMILSLTYNPLKKEIDHAITH